MNEKNDVVLINRTQNFVLLEDGNSLPIVLYFDTMGLECDVDDAVVCVAGDDSVGWYTIDMRDFSFPTIH